MTTARATRNALLAAIDRADADLEQARNELLAAAELGWDSQLAERAADYRAAVDAYDRAMAAKAAW